MKANVREPAFNVPWPVGWLVGVLAVAHGARVLLGISPDRFAFTSQDMVSGTAWPLITYLFVHGGWVHLAMNAIFIAAFGAPVARWLGMGFRGALTFATFFVVCGVIAALGYAGWLDAETLFGHRATSWALVGASGAASGLMGAAARLIEGRGGLGAVTGRRVVGMGAGWILANVVLGVSGLTPGAGGAPVAWQAHIVGFFAGVLIIGVAGRLAGLRTDHRIAP